MKVASSDGVIALNSRPVIALSANVELELSLMSQVLIDHTDLQPTYQ